MQLTILAGLQSASSSSLVARQTHLVVVILRSVENGNVIIVQRLAGLLEPVVDLVCNGKTTGT